MVPYQSSYLKIVSLITVMRAVTLKDLKQTYFLYLLKKRVYTSCKQINVEVLHTNSASHFNSSRFIHTDNDPSNLGLFVTELGAHGLLCT